jgi:chemotaxis protein CheD
MKEINVGLGEHAISRNPEDVLVAYGLGSCVGVVMVDPLSHFAGLLHAVLPRPTGGVVPGETNPYKYVESGVENLLASLIRNGANQSRLVVRIIGGANMLTSSEFTRSFDIGTRNIEAAHATLGRLKLSITAAEVGGHTGRTLRVYVANGRVTVRVIGQKEREI